MSAVVVHYRGGDALDRCIAAALSAREVTELIVADNEGVAEELRARHADARVRVLAMPRNLGFGRAANAGLTVAREGCRVVLNQDAVAAPGAVAELLRVAQESGAWVVGPRLVDRRGEAAATKKRFPAPLAWEGSAAEEEWRTVPWVAGAAMLLARADLRFDPRFHMYVEDEELCYRVWQEGGRVILAERAVVEHAGATAASTRWSVGAITRRTVANRARMIVKHAGPGALLPFALDVVGRRLRRT